jgi:hypothetical protein
LLRRGSAGIFGGADNDQGKRSADLHIVPSQRGSVDHVPGCGPVSEPANYVKP